VASNGKPLAGASVFINNSSKGTVTASDGTFELAFSSSSSFEIIVSFVGYKTLTFKITPPDVPKHVRFELDEQDAAAQDVVVEPIVKDGWQRWGKLFTETFIGKSDLALRCNFKNPYALKFRYNKNTRVLKVTADEPLIVVNHGLGYSISFQLEEYEFYFNDGLTLYIGHQYFTPLKGRNKRKEDKLVKARLEAYNGSMAHFVRSVYAHKTLEEGFEIRRLKKIKRVDSSALKGMANAKFISINGKEMRPITMKPTIKEFDILDKNILPDSGFVKIDSITHNPFLWFDDYLQVVYNAALERPEYVEDIYPRRGRMHPTSLIWLVNKRPIQLEASGLYFDPLDLYTSGYWGWQKLAETLPTDYEPGD